MSKKTETPPVPSFEEIALRRVAQKLQEYRKIVATHAAGERLTVPQMERTAELLEELGLPDFAFVRDAESVNRYAAARAKHENAVAGNADAVATAEQLRLKLETAKKQVAELQTALHAAHAKTNKPEAYRQTLQQLEIEHPHILAPIDEAARLRCDELSRRRRVLETVR